MKRTVSIAILSMLIAGPMSAMQPLAARTATQLAKHYAKKGFSGTMTGLHWAIAAGLPVAFGAKVIKQHANEKEVFQPLTDANEQTTNFVKSELQKTNTTIDAVKICPFYDTIMLPMGTSRKYITISNGTADVLNQALATNDETTLNKWRGTLQHESRHIYHNDLFNQGIACLTVPFATHGLTKTIYNSVSTAKKSNSFAVKQFVKIPTGLGKLTITMCALMAYSRYYEQRADNEVSNDINILKGLKSTIDETEQKNIEGMKPFNLSPSQDKWLRWSTNFLEPHPLPTKRIAKLDERIAALEKQSANNEEICS